MSALTVEQEFESVMAYDQHDAEQRLLNVLHVACEDYYIFERQLHPNIDAIHAYKQQVSDPCLSDFLYMMHQNLISEEKPEWFTLEFLLEDFRRTAFLAHERKEDVEKALIEFMDIRKR